MASALMLDIGTTVFDDGNLRMNPTVFYYDAGLGIARGEGIFIRFLPTATPVQIENAIKSEMIREGMAKFGMALANNDCIFFDIKRG